MKSTDELIDDLLTLAFAEDVGDGDHTTLSTIPADARGKQHLIVKEEGILAGVDIARRVFAKFDPDLKMTVFINDGAHVRPGDIAFEVEGSVRSLLQTERTMLNIMQRMSGIATTTARYQKLLEGLPTKVLDTRKTTPGMRMLEKEAVKIGGGMNHRIGLFDMILIKDNHTDFAGGIPQAVAAPSATPKKTPRPSRPASTASCSTTTPPSRPSRPCASSARRLRTSKLSRAAASPSTPSAPTAKPASTSSASAP